MWAAHMRDLPKGDIYLRTCVTVEGNVGQLRNSECERDRCVTGFACGRMNHGRTPIREDGPPILLWIAIAYMRDSLSFAPKGSLSLAVQQSSLFILNGP